MLRLDTFQAALQGCRASDVGEQRINNGSRVLLPSTALDEISRLSVAYPLQFRIETHGGGKHVFAAVLEFNAERGKVVLPDWMFAHLKLKGRPILRLQTVNLPAGHIIKLQPHNHAFLELTDPRLTLEQRLVEYTVLTAGTTIEIQHAGKTFKFNILEILNTANEPVEAVLTARADAQATELKVEFERPLDMPPSPRRDPTEPNPLVGTNVVGSPTTAGVQFKPFHFVPPTLTGEASSAAPSMSPGSAETHAPAAEEAPPVPSFVAFAGTGRSLGGVTQPERPAPTEGACFTPSPEEIRAKRLAALAKRTGGG